MSKKSFKGGFDSLLGGADHKEEAPQKKVRLRRRGPKPTHEAPVVRATFILDEADLDKFKAIAYWERRNISQQMRQAIAEYVKAYEKKNGPVKPIER